VMIIGVLSVGCPRVYETDAHAPIAPAASCKGTTVPTPREPTLDYDDVGSPLGDGRWVMVRAIVVCGLVAAALVPSAAQASGGVALAWPESQQEIADGSTVTLGEFIDDGGMLPCEAYASATILVNGESTDSASATEPSAWYECSSLTVSGGFTSVHLSQESVRANAEPAISLTNPSGCVYQLGQVEGHATLEGKVTYQVAGSATLKSGALCVANLSVKGSLGLAGPQAGGIGLLLWRSLETLEREARERTEREAGERAERERREREERERRERTEREQREREEQQERAIAAEFGRSLFPTGRSAKLGALLKAGGWSTSFSAPVAGALVVAWYEVPKGAHLAAKPQPLLVAQGRASFTASSTKKVAIKLTRKGKRLLTSTKSIRLTARTSFTPSGRTALTRMKTFVLKR
jgi:hypothetical protein